MIVLIVWRRAGLSPVAGVHFDVPTSVARDHAHLRVLRGARQCASASARGLWQLLRSLAAFNHRECHTFSQCILFLVDDLSSA